VRGLWRRWWWINLGSNRITILMNFKIQKFHKFYYENTVYQTITQKQRHLQWKQDVLRAILLYRVRLSASTNLFTSYDSIIWSLCNTNGWRLFVSSYYRNLWFVQITNQITCFQIKSSVVKSDHHMRFNHDLSQIIIWIRSSLDDENVPSKCPSSISCTVSSEAGATCSLHDWPSSLRSTAISRSSPRSDAKWGTSMIIGLCTAPPPSSTSSSSSHCHEHHIIQT